MNVDKKNNTLNFLFGAFLLLNAISIASDLCDKYRKEKASEKKGCGCGK